MQKALNPEPLQLSFAFDAYELLKSPQFQTSGAELERNCITTDCWPVLEAFADAWGPYDAHWTEYNRLFNLCRDAQGVVRWNPILDAMEEAHKPAEEAFWHIQGKMDKALTAEVACCIAEALQLVGVTDPATVCEVCRCVIRGGELWDGKGFTPGQIPVGVVMDAPAMSVAAPVPEGSNPCPHCGLPNEPGAVRCFSCERQIG